MTDINRLLLDGVCSKVLGPVWRGSKITVANRTNTNADANMTPIPVPSGAVFMRMSARTSQDFGVLISTADLSTPAKNPVGLQLFNGGPGEEFFDVWLNPGSPPSLWFQEVGASDVTVDVILYS
tara:strand:+ start:876 stop:1247 length:372 start_codon:yes stop_codon:yes gene_type:complete